MAVETKTMKVLHLIAAPSIGGAEKLLLMLSKEIDKKKVIIILGVFIDGGHKENAMWNEAIKTGLIVEPIRIKKVHGLMQVIDLVKIIRKHRPDVIHAHGYKTNIIGFFLSIIFHLPIVTTFHGWLQENTQNKFFARLSLILIRYFNKVIAVSQQIRSGLIERGIPPQRIEIIHNIPVVLESARDPKGNLLRKELGIPRDVKIIGFVGRLEYVKGCHIFLEAASLVLSKHPNVYFLVVGDGTEKENLINQAEKCALGKRILFTGFRHDVASMFTLFDLYVLSSLNEGIPLTILEAMFYGIPVVATSVGGVPEVITHNINGLLVTPNDPASLAESISVSLMNCEDSENRVQQAKSLIENEYKVTTWVDKISNIYREMNNNHIHSHNQNKLMKRKKTE